MDILISPLVLKCDILIPHVRQNYRTANSYRCLSHKLNWDEHPSPRMLIPANLVGVAWQLYHEMYI